MRILMHFFFSVFLLFLVIQGSEIGKNKNINKVAVNPVVISFTFGSWSVTYNQLNNLRLSATAGQPLIGSQKLDKYALYSGFWHAPSPDITAIRGNGNTIPEKFSLRQNYPNPFNPQTIIEYNLPEASEVILVLFNSIGQEVNVLVSAHQNAGKHKVTWQGLDNYGNKVASGLYFYKIQAKTKDGRIFTDIQRMLLVK